MYPPVDSVNADIAGLGQYVDIWPTNPYTGEPMQQGTGPGDFTYELTVDGYQMVVYGESGPVMTVP